MLPKPLCAKLEDEKTFDEALSELMNDKPLLDALLRGTTCRQRQFEPEQGAERPYLSSEVYQSVISLVLMSMDSPPQALMHRVPALRIHRASARFDLQRLQRFPKLYDLVLSHVPVPSLKGLTVFETLEVLTLKDCGLTGLETTLPALQWASLSAEKLTDLSALERAPKLRHLQLQDARMLRGLPTGLDQLVLLDSPQLKSLEGLERCPGLRYLDIQRCPALEDIKALSHSANLLDVRLLNTRSLRTLEGLHTHTSLERLNLVHCSALQSLSHIPASGALRHLYLYEPIALKSLKGLPKLPALKSQDYGECPSLEQLEGIEALESLESVCLRHLKITDVSPLAKLPKLRQLDLRGCVHLTQIEALERAPDLRVVALTNTNVDKKELPQQLKAIATFAKNPKMGELAKRARPSAKKVKMSQKERSQLASIRRMLKSKALDQVDQALELLKTVANATFHDELLKATTVGASYGSIKGLHDKAYKGPLQQYVLMGLISTAPPDSALVKTLAPQLTELMLFGTRGHVRGQDTPLAPAHFDRFDQLKSIHLERVGPLIKRGAVPPLPSLQYLSVQHCDPADLWWLQNAPALKDLTLCGTQLDLQGVKHLPALEHFTITANGPLAHEEALFGHPKLKSIHMLSEAFSEATLLQLPALRELSLSLKAMGLNTDALEAKGVKVNRR